VILNLKPEVEAGLLAQAQAIGMSLEEYLISVVEQAALHSDPEADRTIKSAREEAVRRMLDFGDKHHLSLGEPVTRQLLHEGHRL